MQSILNLIRKSFAGAQVVAAPSVRPLRADELRQVVGGVQTTSPRTGW